MPSRRRGAEQALPHLCAEGWQQEMSLHSRFKRQAAPCASLARSCSCGDARWCRWSSRAGARGQWSASVAAAALQARVVLPKARGKGCGAACPGLAGMLSREDGEGAGLRIRWGLGVPRASGWHERGTESIRAGRSRWGSQGGPTQYSKGHWGRSPTSCPSGSPCLAGPCPTGSWPAPLGGRRVRPGADGAGLQEGELDRGPLLRLALLLSLTYSLPYMPQCP